MMNLTTIDLQCTRRSYLLSIELGMITQCQWLESLGIIVFYYDDRDEVICGFCRVWTDSIHIAIGGSDAGLATQ